MKKLELGDSFEQIFKERIKISYEQVQLAYETPDKVQHLENEVTLHLKTFVHAVKSQLLLATTLVQEQQLFAFAYWIPEEIISKDVSLLDLLELFANRYGCKIKVGETTGFFIGKTTKLIYGTLESQEIIELMCSNQTPCNYYCFYKENNISNLNTIECYYCFAINNNRYFTWLYDVKTITIKVPSKWLSYLESVIDILNPLKATQIKILKPQKAAENSSKTLPILEPNNEGTTGDLIIPEIYLKPFNQITETLSTLTENEKIIIIPQFKDNNCLFCKSGKSSAEHIFPKWFRAIFPEKSLDGQLLSRHPGEETLNALLTGVSKGRESSYGYTIHNICEDCNNRWMSRLEESVQKIILNKNRQLITSIKLVDLTEQNSFTLARWITIKALLLAHKAHIVPKLPADTYNELYNNRIPQNFLIEITDIAHYDLNFLVSSGADAITSIFRLENFDLGNAQKLGLNYFQACIHIGNFLFRVSYWDDSTGLIREISLKPTKILYPSNKQLNYYNPEGAEDLFNKTEGKLQLHLFSIGLSLTDYK